MSKNEVREPSQKRSIKKKETIIKEGFKLICKKGFYNTNTAEIAKVADVSTGIVYQYFEDKRDIFLQGIEQYAKKVMFPISNIVSIDINNLDGEFRNIIDESIKKHSISKTAHEEILSLQHSDNDVKKIFENYELDASNNLKDVLINCGFSETNLSEKCHIVVSLIDSLCHELVYHKHKNMNKDVMTNIVINTIVFILKEDV